MPLTPAYQQALDYLYRFVDFSKTHAANLAPENFNLDRMRVLLRRLGSPQSRYPSIHIAGTKGKGSTAVFCSRALTAGGYRTGLYTSPHLQNFSERIQIDGEPIPQGELVELVNAIQPHVAAVPHLSTFEITTALAFLHFAARQVDAAVLEVGLGGRLDATNVVTPAVSVITSISLDHTSILGATLPEIAVEKAGIIKPGVPVVAAPQKQEVLVALRAIAAERGAELILVGERSGFQGLSRSLSGQTLRVWWEDGDSIELSIPLLGGHQLENAATAWTALQTAAHRGLPVSQHDLREGFRRVRWPGRFEILQFEPLVILDAAHNLDSAEKLLRTLDDYLPDRRLTMIFGASADKDVAGFLEIMQPRTAALIATRSEHPRAMAPERIDELARGLGLPSEVQSRIEEALAAGLANLAAGEALLITGSVFVVGAAREVWGSAHRGAPHPR